MPGIDGTRRRLEIRPETVEDYAAIAGVHARAFGNHAREALIVAMHRHRAEFDPGLSLVAELGGQIVGHVLFSPHHVRLLGQTVQAVNLAPIAVDPTRQREGIGGSLIEEGHAIAAAKGYGLAFLLGHASYYPRFGYHTHAYGSCEAQARADTSSLAPLDERAPGPDDIPALQALWHRAEADVDFAIEPGADLLDWISPNPAIESLVYLREDRIVGYTRVHSSDPARPREFLAADADTGRQVAAAVARRAGDDISAITLALHPASSAATGFAVPRCRPWKAAMATSLAPGPLEEYLARIRAGEREPGRVIWPVEFDL